MRSLFGLPVKCKQDGSLDLGVSGRPYWEIGQQRG